MAFDDARAARLIERHEGTRSKPYLDSEGILTIGVGFNLDDVGLFPEEIQYILENRVAMSYEEAVNAFPAFRPLDEIRQIVIVDMVYNLGVTRLSGFRKMWAAVAAGNWVEAAVQMLDSKWARQVGPRAERLAQMMSSGEWPEDV